MGCMQERAQKWTSRMGERMVKHARWIIIYTFPNMKKQRYRSCEHFIIRRRSIHNSERENGGERNNKSTGEISCSPFLSFLSVEDMLTITIGVNNNALHNNIFADSIALPPWGHLFEILTPSHHRYFFKPFSNNVHDSSSVMMWFMMWFSRVR